MHPSIPIHQLNSSKICKVLGTPKWHETSIWHRSRTCGHSITGTMILIRSSSTRFVTRPAGRSFVRVNDPRTSKGTASPLHEISIKDIIILGEGNSNSEHINYVSQDIRGKGNRTAALPVRQNRTTKRAHLLLLIPVVHYVAMKQGSIKTQLMTFH